MITKLEQNAIKAMLNRDLNTDLMAISADKTVMKINRNVNRILEYFLADYKLKTKDNKIGKSAFLHFLLKRFAQDQPALLRFGEFNAEIFSGPSMLEALQEWKRFARTYIDPDITTQTEAVVALLIYSNVREYEVKNNLKVTDYLDDEYEDDMEDLKHNVQKPEPVMDFSKPKGSPGYIDKPPTPDPVLQPVPVIVQPAIKPPEVPMNIEDLFEDDDDDKPASIDAIVKGGK